VNHDFLVSTIPSRQLEVWRRLYDRYSLEPRPASVVPDVSKTIVPTTDADALLLEHGASSNTNAFGAAISSFEAVYGVGAAVRQRVSVIAIARSAGDNQWDRVQLLDISRGVAINISLEVNQTSQVILIPSELVLEPSDQVRILFNGTGVAATTIVCTLWTAEETAF